MESELITIAEDAVPMQAGNNAAVMMGRFILLVCCGLVSGWNVVWPPMEAK